MRQKITESQFSQSDRKWLKQYMINLGFTGHGTGWDKSVWINDNNEIALVVGPLNDARSEVFTKWMIYCADNRSNKFLPDISVPQEVVNPSTGTKVLIAKSERLFEMDSISEHVGSALSFIAKEADIYQNNKTRFVLAINTYLADPAALEDSNRDLLGRMGRMFFTNNAPRIAAGLEYLILHMGTEDIKQLAFTTFDVVREGRKHGFKIDLHSGNFMIASDGDIVINDPWVKYSESMSQHSYYS